MFIDYISDKNKFVQNLNATTCRISRIISSNNDVLWKKNCVLKHLVGFFSKLVTTELVTQ